MTPEAGNFLNKARSFLIKAEVFVASPFPDEAARAAYLASFHAAQAFIFERTSRLAKTHSGVRAEFSRLAKDDSRIPRALLSFLAQGYEYKSLADYSLDENLTLTDAEAKIILQKTREFIECIRHIINSNSENIGSG